MHRDAFNIYVEQLRKGGREVIKELLTTDFLDVSEEEISFVDQVSVEGEAYLAGETLFLNLALKAHALMPCSICNEAVPVTICIDNFYHAEPLEEIKSGVFSFKEIIREAILLELPAFVECAGGCPKRKEIAKYLKQTQEQKENREERYHPFADL